MRQRLQAMAAMDAEVATFTAGARLLRTFAHVIGRPSDFRLASPSQQLGLLREAVAAWQSQQGSPSTPAVIGGGGRAGAPPATPAASGMTFVGSNSNAKRQHDATTALCKRLQRAMRDAKLLGASASAQTNALLMMMSAPSSRSITMRASAAAASSILATTVDAELPTCRRCGASCSGGTSTPH